MPLFDLLSAPWIPVLDTFDGTAGADLRETPDAPLHPREVGLREAILRAHEIREVATNSPLETIALNRLLLALALDVYQPMPDESRWLALWRAPAFPEAPLADYLRQWGERFDLLHAEHPFYQRATTDASQEKKDPAPLAKLFHAQASGNNATLFGHDIDSEPDRLPLADAARGLVGMQAAALGGGVSKPFNFSHAPLVGRAQLWVRGRSLFEALLLNGPPRDEARMRAHVTKRDAPVWRRDLRENHIYKRRKHAGFLDVLTWPSRRLRLATETIDGETVATGVYLTQGDKLEPQPTTDPLAAHVASKTKGVFPLGLRTDRAVWRDASALFSTADTDGTGAPWTFKWATSLVGLIAPDDAEDLTRIFREEGVDVFGLVNDQAKAELWRHERLPLHIPILAEPDRQRDVREALEHADGVARGWKEKGKGEFGLRPAIKTAARYTLSPPAPGADEYPSADPKAVANLAQSLGAEPRFWAALEPRFFRFLRQLAEADGENARTAALADWRHEVADAAGDAFRAATASFDRDARHLRAVAEGHARLRPSTS